MNSPIDTLTVGDWLLCTDGPMIDHISDLGELNRIQSHNGEGALYRILGIQAPTLLVMIYPLSGPGDNEPIPCVVPYDRMGWVKPSPSFVRAYLKFTGYRPPKRRVRMTVAERAEIKGWMDKLARKDME